MDLRRRVLISAAAIIGAMTFGGCSNQPDANSVAERSGKGVIHGTPLRSIMLEINTVIYDRHLSEIERENERRRYALRLADKVNYFASAIKQYPERNELKQLDEKQLTRFYGYVNEVQSKAEEVRELARVYEMEKLQHSLDDLLLTCKKCHNDLRDEH